MTEIIDLLAKAILEFSHETAIIPLLIIGYIWVNKEVFFHSICLILMSMMFNASLKATFQIPLPAFLGKDGFAFPSGHMQSSAALYMYLYMFSKSLALKIGLIILLTLIGLSLIYFGYHNIYDVVGAAFFSLALIYAYKYLYRNISKRNLFVLILIFASSCLLYINFIHKIPSHLYMAYYALFGLLTAEYYCDNKKITANTKKSKLLATLLCFVLVYVVHVVLTIESDITSFIQPLRYFFIGVSIPFSIFLSNLIYRQTDYVDNRENTK